MKMPTELEKAKIEKELERLVAKYGRGQELDLEWRSRDITRYYETMGRKMKLAGEVDTKRKVIKIYTDDFKEALDVVVHEFFEYIFDKLITPTDVLFNEVTDGFQRAFNRIRYDDKETFIKLLVKMERKERKKNKCS